MTTLLNMPSASPATAPGIAPYRYLCLDLETTEASPEVADRWMRHCWEPDTLSGDRAWKPDTVTKRLIEMHAKKKDQLALMDEAPIAVIAVKSDTEFRLLHCMTAADPYVLDGATVQGFASEADMLRAFRFLLEAAVVLPGDTGGGSRLDLYGCPLPPTEFVAHNGRAFDMPKLRTRYLANALQLPPALVGDLPLFDTMKVFSHRFGIHGDGFIGLDCILEILGLETHKGLVSGAEIPLLIRLGEFEKVIRYALLDVADTENIFLRMVGKHPALT